MKLVAGQGRGAPYSIEYQTRSGSGAYLDAPKESNHADNIDFFHLYRAYQAIDAWFKDRSVDEYALNNLATEVSLALFKRVRVIWYEASQDIEAIPLFTRLNIGRIPLTAAELVKAALLSAARSLSSDRAHEISAQWDSIERDLHHPDIWTFVAGIHSNAGDERYPTRVSLLLDTLADDEKPHNGGPRPRYRTFEVLQERIEKDFSALWKDVVALHAQVIGWHEVPDVYNKIGFLVAMDERFGEITAIAKGKRKSEFDQFLTRRIKQRLRVRREDLLEYQYDDKKAASYRKLRELLLLMNVETCSRAGQRFPFAFHVGESWSLEHIHAQNADTLNKAEQWRTWLVTHDNGIDALGPNHEGSAQLKQDIRAAVEEIDSGRSGGFSGERFEALSRLVLILLGVDGGPDHTIRNLALLSSSDNSRLNNSVFEVKRQMILELDRAGKYVPACTRNVFLKYYAKADAQQPHYWSEQDKESYLYAVIDLLTPYLD
jgi:hypothetical protein